MELKHIPLDQLHVAAVNMRHACKAPDTSEILPSVRARGILQPLLVRPNADGLEIVAGRWRFLSAKTERPAVAFSGGKKSTRRPGEREQVCFISRAILKKKSHSVEFGPGF